MSARQRLLDMGDRARELGLTECPAYRQVRRLLVDPLASEQDCSITARRLELYCKDYDDFLDLTGWFEKIKGELRDRNIDSPDLDVTFGRVDYVIERSSSAEMDFQQARTCLALLRQDVEGAIKAYEELYHLVSALVGEIRQALDAYQDDGSLTHLRYRAERMRAQLKAGYMPDRERIAATRQELQHRLQELQTEAETVLEGIPEQMACDLLSELNESQRRELRSLLEQVRADPNPRLRIELWRLIRKHQKVLRPEFRFPAVPRPWKPLDAEVASLSWDTLILLLQTDHQEHEEVAPLRKMMVDAYQGDATQLKKRIQSIHDRAAAYRSLENAGG